jgi:ribose transport system permease protein
MTIEATRAARSSRAVIQSLGTRLWDTPGAFYLLVFLFVGLSFASPHFLTTANLINVVLQASVILILALGVTLVIITEGIDLSLGPVLGFAGVVFALLLVGGYSYPFAMAAALIAAMAVGALNGYCVAYQNLQPFIVTLGSFGIALSFGMALTSGEAVTGLPQGVRWFNEGNVLGLPFPIWVTAALFVITYVVLHYTKFGRYIYAIGGNKQALILTGTRVRLYHAGVYVYAAGCAGIAAFIMTARTNSAQPIVGVGLEFDAIAAAVLGGTSFAGGKGGVVGTVAGAIAVATLRNGLNLMGVVAEWQAAAVGFVIIAAVATDSIRGQS